MHSFLGSVGFNNIKTRSDIEKLQDYILKQGAERYLAAMPDKRMTAEIRLEVAENVGVSLFGEYDEKGEFHMEHYFPFLMGRNESSKAAVLISKRVDTDAYTGMCEDLRIGVSLIFYLQNVTDFLTRGCPDDKSDRSITLAALASDGKILLPTLSMKDTKVKEPVQPSGRDQLLAAARSGDKDALDALSMEDMDIYDKITERLKNEDILSIVETSFIPYGSESDNYTILAAIESVTEQKNCITGEELYILDLRCNDISFPVCISKASLYGEPKPGRRFRGNIWLQGTVNFDFS